MADCCMRVELFFLPLQVIGPGGLPREAENAVVHPPQRLDFCPAELHSLERFAEAAQAWGWRWRLVRQEPDQAQGAAELTRTASVLGTILNGTELQASSTSSALNHCCTLAACQGSWVQACAVCHRHVSSRDWSSMQQ